MLEVWLLCGFGLALLVIAGDLLVRGAVSLALKLGIPPLIVGLTIVAFGTSAPELLVSIRAAVDGVGGIALGNVIGSNIANVLLVLGLPAIIMSISTSECDSSRSYLFMMGATLLFVLLAFQGVFSWWAGLILLAALGIVLIDQILHARALRGKPCAEEGTDVPDPHEADKPYWKIAGLLVLGLIGLPLGAELLVQNAVVIATNFGVSETVIGLTLVAIGTSLPELTTSMMAAIRGRADVGIGNVIGSNMFNLLFIIGAASMVAPLPVDPELLEFDLWVMLATSLLLIPFVFMKMNIGRLWGSAMTIAYIAYILSLVA